MVDIVKTAIRTATAWAADETAMDALYGDDNYYTKLSTWESNVPSDLVTDDEQWVVECYNDWASGLDDAVDITERATDATRNIVITSPESERHDGQVDSGFRLVYANDWGRAFASRSDYTEISYLQIEYDGKLDSLLIAGSDYQLIDSVIIISDSTNSNCLYLSTRLSTVQNSLTLGGAIGILTANYTGASILNCTVIGATTGVSDKNAGTGHYQPVINTVCYDCTTSFSTANVFHPDSENNADDTGDVVTLSIGTIDDIASTDFTDAANDDYSLASGSALIDEGTDLSTDFTDDIAGETRGTTWDIGAFEYISSGAATIAAHVMHYFKQMRQ